MAPRIVLLLVAAGLVLAACGQQPPVLQEVSFDQAAAG